jgi:exodeoxyribonuclease VII large subunit
MDEAVVFTVSEVSFHLKQVIETQIEPLYVRGEISNYTHHGSGHIYFNLKDANSTLRCTFFRYANLSLAFKPEDGMEVVCFGKLTVFEKGGTYNLNVQSMVLSGQGDLSRKFEELKKKLEQEGLFDPARKRALPKYPARIGIVTSPTGAALQDIINILKRRFPVMVEVYPALVQGSEAPAQLIRGLKYFNRAGNVELIILTRGGGSQEDLWCFNDEGLARAIHASELPVVSAVGHEIDFSISDFVADLRAPTPSAAAEFVVPDKADLLTYLGSLQRRLAVTADHNLARGRNEIGELELKLNRYSPDRVWQSLQQRYDLASQTLGGIRNLLRPFRHRYELARGAFASAIGRSLDNSLLRNGKRLAELEQRLRQKTGDELKSRRIRLDQMSLQLSELSPLNMLKRGYSIVHRQGQVISSVNQTGPGDRLDLMLSDGGAGITVNEIRKQDPDA